MEYMDIDKLNIEKLEKIAGILKAISHPMRVAILDLLDKKGEMTVSEIYSKLGLEQSTTSHHLGILKSKGVLGCKKKGKSAYYSFKDESFSRILDCIGNCPL